MNKKISVIIPVYNTGNYLVQCLENVLSQTYRNLDIILVDDGSTDGSSELCDLFSMKDDRVRVIHKVNNGLSSSRNTGIKYAAGDYAVFLDSDDFWNDKAALSNIMNNIKPDMDLVCFGYKEYVDGRGENGVGTDFSDFSDKSDKNELISEMHRCGLYISSAWCKIVRLDVIRDNNLYFQEGITSEDVDWSARLLKKISSISVYCDSFYAYRQRSDSIVHNIKYRNIKNLADSIIKCVDIGKDITDAEENALYYNYVSYQYITFLKVAFLCEDDPRTKLLVKEMKSYKWLLKYHLNKKVKIVYLFNKLLGFNLMHKCLKIYSKG